MCKNSRLAGILRRAGLVDLQEFDIEDQRRVRRDDTAGAARAVAELGRDDEGALAAALHAGDTLVPALDDLAAAQGEAEGLAAVDRAVEFLALLALVVEPARVMDADLVAGGRGGAVANLAVGVFEAAREFAHLAWCSLRHRRGEPGRRGKGEDRKSRGRAGEVDRFHRMQLWWEGAGQHRDRRLPPLSTISPHLTGI